MTSSLASLQYFQCLSSSQHSLRDSWRKVHFDVYRESWISIMLISGLFSNWRRRRAHFAIQWTKARRNHRVYRSSQTVNHSEAQITKLIRTGSLGPWSHTCPAWLVILLDLHTLVGGVVSIFRTHQKRHNWSAVHHRCSQCNRRQFWYWFYSEWNTKRVYLASVNQRYSSPIVWNLVNAIYIFVQTSAYYLPTP